MNVSIGFDELEALFDSLAIWAKVTNGILTVDLITTTMTPAHHYPGATSVMARLRNATGFQIGTIHRIFYPDGKIVHQDSADLVIGDLKLTRKKQL